MKIEIRRKNKTSKWYWRILARNKKVLATSETYSSKRMAEKGVRSLISSIHKANVLVSD